ncbi:glycosyltransferase family 2 protein [Aliarcobacter butzleri]|uniref:glycosyltransferase family 2 protein n=1 Tax=Aliarcobacter butzleri TaxID=28197 RepID=UPI001C0A756D|nr:glycosyltransferase [Aliarcobacter butzleri]
MESNKQLSIVIPTYNRADFLDYSLKLHIPIVKKYNICIYISDNASTDNTKEVINKWQKEYNFLHYSKNYTNIGPDGNFEKALKMADANYTWLLGDTISFQLEDLELLMSRIIDNKFEAIILNSTNRVENIDNCIFSDHNILLRSLGWHMTQMSSLIFSKELLENSNFTRYYKTNFIQTGIIFEYLAYKNFFKVLWNSDISIKGINIKNIKKTSWETNTFEIWLMKWPTFIFSLPSLYSLECKYNTILTHNSKTRLFRLKNLLNLKMLEILTLKECLIYRKFLKFSGNKFLVVSLITALILPSNMIKFLKNLIKNV